MLPEDDFFSTFLNTTFVTALPINSFDNFRKVEEAAHSREPLELDDFFTVKFSANCIDDLSFNDSRRIKHNLKRPSCPPTTTGGQPSLKPFAMPFLAPTTKLSSELSKIPSCRPSEELLYVFRTTFVA